jgi:hypothetical protein
MLTTKEVFIKAIRNEKMIREIVFMIDGTEMLFYVFVCASKCVDQSHGIKRENSNENNLAILLYVGARTEYSATSWVTLPSVIFYEPPLLYCTGVESRCTVLLP